MTDEDKARFSAGLAIDLRQALSGSGVPIECIGVRSVPPFGVTELVVYVRDRSNGEKIPTAFEGFPVKSFVVGRIATV